MPKVFESNRKLHEKILEGVNILTDNVASTLGPKGRNVILHREGRNPIITKDGVTVAEFVEFADPFNNLGAQIIKQAASQTNNVAGDGTTTATVLARAILEHAQKYILAGVAPSDIKRGIDRAVEAICNELRATANPIISEDEICQVATISANGDENIGKMITLAIDSIGKDGTITVEEGRSLETTLDIIEGFRIDSGYVAKAFVTDERRNIVRHKDVLILVTDYSIERVEDMLPTLEIAARSSKALVVVADSIEDQALAALIMNSVRGTMKVVGVKAPQYGEERRNILSDLAVSVGATYITREKGLSLQNIKLEHLGKAKSIEVLSNSTVIVGGKSNATEMDDHIASLKALIKQTDELAECEKIQERIVRLASGVAIVKVGAPTEIEMIEKKHRIEDALEAVRSAQMEGIVLGGGTALVRSLGVLDSLPIYNEGESIGISIIRHASKEPLRQMALNADVPPDVVLNLVENADENMGYDFAQNEMRDLLEAGIIDPVKVTTSALLNAASVISTLLTTNYAIVEVNSAP